MSPGATADKPSRMIAVSNTTPLRYLLAIGQQDLLRKLFDRILIPPAVFEELTAIHTPAIVRDAVSSSSEWIEIREAKTIPSAPHLVLLHRGERQAILLAEAVQPDFLLLDDKAARAQALLRGLPLSGTLGVLERGDALGYTHAFPETLKRLKTSGFFLSPSLEKLLLARHKIRRAKST